MHQTEPYRKAMFFSVSETGVGAETLKRPAA